MEQTSPVILVLSLSTNTSMMIKTILIIMTSRSTDCKMTWVADLEKDVRIQNSICCQIGVVVLLAVVYCATSLTAVLGNSTVIFIVLTSRRMQVLILPFLVVCTYMMICLCSTLMFQSVTNFFIANLALADVIIGLLVIPFQFQAAFLQIWTLPDFLCSFCPFFQVKDISLWIFSLDHFWKRISINAFN